jgi:hypothetical protein
LHAPFAQFLATIAAFLLFLPVASHAQVAHGSFDEGSERSLRFRIYPGVLWTPTAGFGAGLGAQVDHLTSPGSRLLVVAMPAQHMGSYFAEFHTGNPVGAVPYGKIGAYYHGTDRWYYHGIGSRAALGDRLALSLRTFDLEAALGTPLLHRSLRMQMMTRLAVSNVRRFREEDEGALLRMDTASRELLEASLGRNDSPLGQTGSVRTGIVPAIDLAFDTRDALESTTRGILTQAFASHYVSLQNEGLSFTRLNAEAHFFVPLPGADHVLSLTTKLERILNHGSASVPIHLFPAFDHMSAPGLARNRYIGEEVVSVQMEYKNRLLSLFDAVALDAFAIVSTASIGGFQGFFGEAADASRVMSTGVGGRIINLRRDQLIVTGTLGYGPDGFVISDVRLVHDFRFRRPRLR